MAVFGRQSEIKCIDEIVQYQAGRYISSNEAVWRILSFPMHERSPVGCSLSGTFTEWSMCLFFGIQRATKSPESTDTKLTAFFSLCKNDSFAKKLLYTEVPSYTRGILKIKYLNVEKRVSQSTANLPSSKIPR